ncbi:DedA family protein [Mycobacterium sp.]|jgi:membrane protein DedA with SNARE-associated domain|uniref:DedA family protein n=1 Tax=Mycobacterium sp. TaxID=1785 RepID=UPI003341F1B7|nr:putative rane-associated protein [Mycobacterium sp.]
MTDTQLPGVFADMQPVLEHWGYLGVGGMLFLEDFGVPVPGEIMLIAAAIVAGAGQMNIAVVFLVAVLAAVIGDNIGFIVGHFGGRPLAERFGRYVFLTPERLDRTENYFNRHGGKIVTVARFIDGLRQINGLLAGIGGMGWLKFLGYNALGAVLWVGTWCALGYLAGENIVDIYDTFERYKWYVIGALAVVVAIVIAHRVRRRRAERTA